MKNSRWIVAVVTVIAVVAFGTGPAAAKRASVETQIVDMNVQCGLPSPPHCLYSGYIESPANKCLANRKVKIFALFNNQPPKLVDTTRTSKNGGFGGRGTSGNVSAAKAKVLKETVGSTTCKGDVFEGA